MAPHSSTLAWKIPWTEEPGRLQSMGSRRVRHDWATSLSLFTFMHWRRQWHPTPVFLPGESQGRQSLVGCRLWGRTESDTAGATQQQQQRPGSLPGSRVGGSTLLPLSWSAELFAGGASEELTWGRDDHKKKEKERNPGFFLFCITDTSKRALSLGGSERDLRRLIKHTWPSSSWRRCCWPPSCSGKEGGAVGDWW